MMNYLYLFWIITACHSLMAKSTTSAKAKMSIRLSASVSSPSIFIVLFLVFRFLKYLSISISFFWDRFWLMTLILLASVFLSTRNLLMFIVKCGGWSYTCSASCPICGSFCFKLMQIQFYFNKFRFDSMKFVTMKYRLCYVWRL